MIQVKFKNLDSSEIAREATMERIRSLVDKFPDLSSGKILVTLEMDNSPLQSGLDLFRVKIHILRGRYKGITVAKENLNLYVALADVVENMLEVLNRFGDKARAKARKHARGLSHEIRNLEVGVEVEIKRRI